ncbi:MAG: DUF3427 domain-containing protein, partial [Ignavibacteria bacterium]|nr:DUF3427 domain-containing protein [Ignavibacteria bacterium]
TELFFVTIDKRMALHEGVAYDDYAISSQLFHWQSQNSTTPRSMAGRRYIESNSNDWRFQLFIREKESSPYYACGPVTLVSSQGERPMSIVWKFETPLPVRLFQKFSVLK